MTASPSEVGARAEAAVAMALTRAGARVYVPLFCAHSRVDLVVEDERGLHRVQCKTGRLVNGVLSFRTCSNTANSPKDYRGEVEFFGVYSPDLDQVFLVPADVVPSRAGHLRVRPARNRQVKGLRWAHEYRVGPALPPSGSAHPIDQ